MLAPPVPARGRIAPFDGIRAIAVSLVLWEHALGSPWVQVPGLRGGEVPVGSMGVIVFFVLSGLLITGLLRDELATTGTVSLRAFYWRRTFRIVPPVVVLLVVLAAGAARGWWQPPSSAQWLHLVTWTVNYSQPTAETSHLWSLSVEEQFYLAWPLLFVTLGVARARRLLVPLVLLPPLVRFGAWYVSQAAGEAMWHQMEGVVDALAAGALAALVAEHLTASPGYQRWLRTAWPAWLPVLLALASVTTLWARLWGLVGNSLVVASAVLYLDWLQRCPNTRSARCLSWPPMQWLGRISYSVYVFHLPILQHVLPRQPALQVLVAIAVGHVSFHTIEAWASRYRSVGPGQLPVPASPIPSRSA